MSYSINPASGYFTDLDWSKKDSVSLELQRQKFAIPDSLSNDFVDPSGYQQQTFLGASIRSFNTSAGYGDSSSTLSVELVNDEYNASDRTGLGLGHDVYHNGKYDTFAPPVAGSPVFFQFGKKRASVNEAYQKILDDIYGYNNALSSPAKFHFTFGGILQSYVQNRGPGGNPLYSVQVVDPREILANTTLILNNYAGTTFNNKNMFNLYGFLEYNPTLELKEALDNYFPIKDVLRKNIFPNGSYTYTGLDLYADNANVLLNENFTAKDFTYEISPQGYPYVFPITGTGFSRRCSQGMPYYRIKQGLEALLGLNGILPQEYIAAGFGGYINFRGFNYLVDLSGLKKVDNYYFFDFDQINLLDFCLEMCDITSSDLFVSLMPVINHPVYARFFNWNQTQTGPFGDPTKIIAGVIRVDAIDRSFQPQYGAIKNYIDSLATKGVYVENQDVGFELSNVTTDKFVSGAQEVDMYFFSANADRDTLEVRKQRGGQQNALDYYLKNQWNLETSLSQQILPYYGMLGNNAVSITKGFGAYQQILLDSTGLNAAGVRNYYVATEMELRAALISFERWSEFIASYDSIYMESLEDDDKVEGAALQQTAAPDGAPPIRISNNYAVTVPRSVFPTDDNTYGPDDLPNNTCNPPYGYPLYYKRATRLGVQAMGLTDLTGKYTNIITSGSELIGAAGDNAKFAKVLQNEWDKYKNLSNSKLNEAEKKYVEILQKAINGEISKAATIGLIQGLHSSMKESIKHFGRLAKKVQANAMKVYNFVKKVADECLGKKFLVKIPREVNLFYDKKISVKDNDIRIAEYEYGPFGFRPRSINYNPYYESSQEFQNLIEDQRSSAIDLQSGKARVNTMDSFLTREIPNPTIFHGALNVNFNPLIDKHEFNYAPTKQGGFVNFDLAQNLFNQKLNLGISQGLVPQDMGKFLDENNRMSAYVRFDNSESLDFSSVNSDDFTQQGITAAGFIPDVSDILDNNQPSSFSSLPNADSYADPEATLEASGTKVGPAIAFMKCDVDENLYMPPKTLYRPVELHGIELEDIGEYSTPSKVWIPGLCREFSSFTFYRSNFIPVKPPDGGSPFLSKLDFARQPNGLIDTKVESLDTEHVYALITLPSRAVSTIDARFRDGPFQLTNPERFKHYMCMDVVRLPEFEQPAFRGAATNLVGGRKLAFTAETLGNAIEAYAAAMRSVDAVYPNRINITFPSPVYPDLVALPLMSKERCYGPWVSSQIDRQAKVYDNVAGKVEFIKDENLAPWNFNGYDLMNAAGELQARFSNSLLLHSERGGFVIPEAPSGIYLGKFLANAGPLVTNINVDVSEAGIKTTYKMDLYTSSFGKLQKQKQDMISNISRERQKLKDEKNALIRKGLGKAQTSVNYNLLYKRLDNQSNAQVDSYRSASYPPPTDLTVISSTPQTNPVHATNTTMAAGTTQNATHHQVNGSQLPAQYAGTAMAYQPDSVAAQNADYNTAGSSTTDQYAAYSHEQGHPSMASVPQVPPANSHYAPQFILDSDEYGEPPDYSIFD